ncbi:MAG: leucyl/phenylalanyl-tRNA--protein transferase [Cyclobacteriaceae bacterium]
MPVPHLSEALSFPPVSQAEPDGLVAIGGDLSPERLMLAYRSGIFPWFNEDEPIMWYSPNPRSVLLPENLHISGTLKGLLKQNKYEVRYNTDFRGVIGNCRQAPRVGQDGTWISQEMQDAYIRLHELGLATSVEVWREEKLVGGIYGIDLGHVFCGESMFSLESNTSKIALVTLVQDIQKRGGILFDCQVHSTHVESMGAVEIPREEFVGYLEAGS